MPKLVEYDTAAENLKKGDKVRWRNRQWTVEGNPETKVKFTTFEVAESVEPLRLERWQHVKLLREEPTAREEYDRLLARWAAQQKRELRRSDEAHDAANDEAIAHVKKFRMDYVVVERAVRADSLLEIQSLILNILYRMDPTEPRGRDQISAVLDRADDSDILEAYHKALKEVRSEVWRRSGRTTNPVAQAIEETRFDAKRDWVDRHDGMVEHLDELEREAKEEEAKAYPDAVDELVAGAFKAAENRRDDSF